MNKFEPIAGMTWLFVENALGARVKERMLLGKNPFFVIERLIIVISLIKKRSLLWTPFTFDIQ